MRRVDPKVYTKKYYLTDCTGYNEYKESLGDTLEVRFQELMPYLNVKKNEKVLDIGCGRGELVYLSAKNGADAYGIDYSKDGVNLAEELKKTKNKDIQKRMHFSVMDAKKLTFSDSFFSTVILTDVVEHLYPEELDLVFKEIKRVLKKNGKVVIHTAPNKWFNDYGYRLYCYPLSSLIIGTWNAITRRSYPNIATPKELRTDSHAIMHINEPTYFSLMSLYRKYNFKGSIKSTNITVRKPVISYKDKIINTLVFLHPISKSFPFNVFFGSDFVSILKNTK